MPGTTLFSLLLLATISDKANAGFTINYAKHNETMYRSWNPAPQERGTMEILTSLTDPTPMRLFLFRFWWMIVGIFTPEVTMWVAYRQWQDARALLRKMKERYPELMKEDRRTVLLRRLQKAGCALKAWFLKYGSNGANQGHDLEIGRSGNEEAEEQCLVDKNRSMNVEGSDAGPRIVEAPLIEAGCSTDVDKTQLLAKMPEPDRSYPMSGLDESTVGNGNNSEQEAATRARSGSPIERTASVPVSTPETIENNPPPPFKGQKHKKKSTKSCFSIKSALFVVMGGCAIDSPDSVEGHPLTVTPRGFLELCKEGLIEPSAVNDALVGDKSKTDGLAKTLVLTQALWLVVQCFGRAFSGLPLALLEIHTAIHVACAFLTYLLWWNKPQGVLLPYILPLPKKEADLFYCLYAKSIHQRRLDAYKHLEATKDNEGRLQDSTKRKQDDGGDTSFTNLNTVRSRWEYWQALYSEIKYRERDSSLIGVLCLLLVDHYGWHETFRITGWDGSIESTGLETPSSERIEVPTISHTTGSFERRARMGHPNVSLSESLGFIKDALFGVRRPEKGKGLRAATGLGVCIMLYGGLHIAASGQKFPTEMEGILWWISSVASTAFFGAFVIAVALFAVFETMEVLVDLTVINAFIQIGILISLTIIICMVLVFFSSRAYLVVESFLSLRTLHVDVFKVVPWSNYWPHF
ncbi:hypothetical protein BJ508DRAFT_158888 [Ascobolus immersus RN42]|uniref:Uncharacterized protein n=1 Tax=Ascobolus immersus RN42 TaxID=1160509 RepID=A0A3N4IK14_ASCIM|nr:hypothetical protein BJ508DRAFT_158888 [Ascobolus immersus RN42]